MLRSILSSGSVDLDLFYAAWLFFCFFEAAALVCFLFVCLFAFGACLTYCGRERPSESSQFQGLPEANWSCLPFVLRSFPGTQTVAVLEKTHKKRLGKREGSKRDNCD